jgi:hypothetical protein
MASRYGRTVCSPDYETYEINAFLNYIFGSRVLNATFISNYHRNIFFWHSDETTSDVKLFLDKFSFILFISFPTSHAPARLHESGPPSWEKNKCGKRGGYIPNGECKASCFRRLRRPAPAHVILLVHLLTGNRPHPDQTITTLANYVPVTSRTLSSRSSSKQYLRIRSVPEREHRTSPLQR